jgi:hypothetical protein
MDCGRLKVRFSVSICDDNLEAEAKAEAEAEAK